MTMKIIILVVISLVATICSESSDIRRVIFATKIYKLQSIYLQKCAKNLDFTQLEEIDIAFNYFSKCFNFESDMMGLSMKNSCSNFDKQYVTCLQNFTKVAKACLDTNEKYLLDFLINGEQRFLDRLCKGNELDHIKTLLDNCKLQLGDLILCVSKLNIFNNLDSKDYYLNRIDVCSDLKTLQKCLIKNLQTNCVIAKEDTDLLNSVYEEYQKECSLANTNMSNFIVLTLLVISSKLSQ